MRRREVLALLGGALAPAPYAVLAQPSHRAVIGYLGLASAISHSARMNAFRAGLRDLGYSEGKMFSSSSVGLRGIMIDFPRWPLTSSGATLMSLSPMRSLARWRQSTQHRRSPS